MIKQDKITRWSGADWSSELKDITMVGAGGINSWTILNLSRIGHSLLLFDQDDVDETNVGGGQMFRTEDIGNNKCNSVVKICRQFGCTNVIDSTQAHFEREVEEYIENICICGVDNMKARKEVFEAWMSGTDGIPSLFIDGRLTMEMYEVFAIQRNKPEQIEDYRQRHLFSDAETVELDCTTKQSTFSAMGISSMITATLCNWLTNEKLQMEFREVPFYQRMYLPIFHYRKEEIGKVIVEEPVVKKREYKKKAKIIES